MENMLTEKENNSGSYDPTKESVHDYLKNNKSMYNNNGKYFDSYLFNRKFDDYIKNETEEKLLESKIKTNDLNHLANIKAEPYELPLNKIMINIKNMWFSLFDDIMIGNNPFEDFGNNKIFYMAISLVTISLLFIFLCTIFY